MNLFATLYIILASVSFTIALIHFLTWLQVKKKISCLLFTIVAISAGALSIFELLMLQLTDIALYEYYIRFYHVPLYIFLVSVVWFIYDYFGTGRKWMARLFTVLWSVGLLINFISESCLTYKSIIGLTENTAFNGEVYTVVTGDLNPLRLIVDFASILFFVYIIDASIKLFKKGNKERAILVGGSIALFMLVSGIIAPLADIGVLKGPPMVSAPFVFILLAMSFELKSDIVRASELSISLEYEKNKWKSLLSDINLPVVGVDKNGVVNFVNSAILQILECSRDEVLGKGWLDKFIPERYKEKVLNEFKIPLKEGFPVHFRNPVLTKSGKERLLYWSNVGVYNKGQEFIGLTAIGSDITDKENAYKEIVHLKEQLEVENLLLREDSGHGTNPDDLICQSDAIVYALDKAKQVSQVNSTVLLEGETGVGKGVFAKYIHANSSNAKMPFVVVNCAALPTHLLESELFGYEKGAFTGAVKLKKGRFELAEGGTLFLDEVGELPFDLQPKLLRVLQDGCFERLGGEKTIKVNIRIIAATNKLLSEQVKNGRFREDLYYRLNVFPITIPPLRKRIEDIPKLVDHFVTIYSTKYNKNIVRISKQTYNSFCKYNWPGNIRELQNLIERAVISAKGEVLKTNGLLPSNGSGKTTGKMVVKKLEEVERLHIIEVLKECEWQIHGESGAAIILGINPSTLRSRMKKLGIEKEVMY